MFNLEQAIKSWLKAFNKHRAFDHGNVQEMEVHLRDHIEDLIAEGHSDQEAFEIAVEEFGDIPQMAEEEYTNISRGPSLRSLLYTTMLNNYFKTTFRSMLRSPLTSFINVFGLSLAIGICLVVYAFFQFNYSVDQFHENKETVYHATFIVDREGKEEQYGLSPAPLGEMLKADFPQIKRVSRIQDHNVVVKFDDKVFHERIRFTDAEFLSLFTFPLKWGLSASLSDVNSIILSENSSIKYFGDENPIGQSIQVIFGKDKSKSFTITGVAKKFPVARTVDFDFLVNFANYDIASPGFNVNDWSEQVRATLIQVNHPEDIHEIIQGSMKYKELQNEVDNDWPIDRFKYEQLATLHLNSRGIRDGISFDGNLEARTGMPIIGIFMLVLACFNYINIAIVSAARRLKEIGLRKVIGASKSQVIFQFLSENILVTCFALLMGIILAVIVIIPWFREFAHWPLELDLMDYNLWLFFGAIVFITGIASGTYPAFYISRFDAVKIFKGTVRFGKKNPLTKIFLGIQMVMSCAGITIAVIFAQNNTYQNERSWGYDKNDTQYSAVPDGAGFERLRAQLEQNPDILSISGSEHHLGKHRGTAVVHLPDREYEVGQLSVDANYAHTMGLEITQGRFFKEGQASDKRSAVVNQLFVKNAGIVDPLAQTFKIDTIQYNILGVVEDFHMFNFYNPKKPTVLLLGDSENYQYLSLKTRPGTGQETYRKVQKEWLALFPEIPFQGGFQQDVWVGYFEQVDTATQFYWILASIAVLLTSLGLYGLVTLNVAGRVREFSIRKVLGADFKHIAANILKQYAWLFGLSLVVGIPFSYFMANTTLHQLYIYPMPMTYSGVIIGAVMLVTILIVVTSTQVRRVSTSDPVHGLKTE